MKAWLSQRRHLARRLRTIKKIEDLGFKIRDVSGVHQGVVSTARFLLTDPDGNPMDNLGDGFPTVYEAYKAVRAWMREHRP